MAASSFGGLSVAEVFVSYNQKNRALIEPIGARLAALGVNVWYDREIDPAEGFGAALRARLRQAKVVLVCWSPEAVESEWVSGEAEYAIDIKNYLPIYIRPCVLMPPFNRIQTEDLSDRAESASNLAWLKLVERISKMIGREGVAAAAKAYAGGNEKALYDFARRYPEEPAAKSIWSEAEARHRSEFQSCLEEARATLAERTARITADAADLQSSLDGQTAAFEAWVADERRGAATGPKPDPSLLVKRHIPAEERKLRGEVVALSSALGHAKAVEEELEAAKTEIARFQEQLAEKSDEVKLLREEIAPLSDGKEQVTALSSALAQAKGVEEELTLARAEIAQLKKELEDAASELATLRSEVAALSGAAEKAKAPGSNLEAANTKFAQLSASLEFERQQNKRKHPDDEESKTGTLSNRLWVIACALGSLVSIILFILFILFSNSSFDGDRRIAPVFALLFIVASAISVFAYRRSKRRKVAQ